MPVASATAEPPDDLELQELDDANRELTHSAEHARRLADEYHRYSGPSGLIWWARHRAKLVLGRLRGRAVR